MSERIDPITGSIVPMSHGARRIYGHFHSAQLTAEQRALAQEKVAWSLAEKVHDWAKNPEGGKWFTKWKLNLTPSQISIVHRGVDLGIFRKDHDKQWWKHTQYTWPWLLTALALRDEWNAGPEAEAIRRAIIPKNTKSPTDSPPGSTPKQTV